MQLKKMMEEMSSILWGLSLAVNIILLLVGLPLCLLICCCCRKHQGAIEKDIKMIARNHNILQNEEIEDVPKALPAPQKRRVKLVQNKQVKVQKEPLLQNVDDDQEEIQQIDDSNYQMEDE